MAFLASDLTALMDIEAELVAGDGTTFQDLVQPQIGPIAIAPINLANSDVIDHHVQIRLTKGGVDAIAGSVTVAAGAGTGGAGITTLFSQVFVAFTGPQPVGPGVKLSWRVEEAVTLSYSVTLQTTIGQF